MSTPEAGNGRVRAYFQFLLAVVYFFVARTLAARSAAGLSTDTWAPLAEQAILAFLLLFGYAAIGFWLNRQNHPISEQGLPRRQGWQREIALGLATGWGLALVCILPTVLIGGIAISLSTDAQSWKWLIIDIAFFAFATLAEEIAFRGYGFQRFVRAVGPIGGAIGFSAYYAIVQSLLPGSSRTTLFTSIAISLVLSAAYLRTRAIWISWGLNFAWKASRALIFGLAVAGVNSNSPVIQGNPMGPFWVTGGGFGLEGSWITFIFLIAALPFIFRITQELDFRYNAPVLVPGGIPVDISPAAQAQHTAAMGPVEPPAPSLIQIVPVPANRAQTPEGIEPRASGDSY
jgi:uncharacterized protein